MADWKPIEPLPGQPQGWSRKQGYTFAATRDQVPLLLAEIPIALAVYPLAIRTADYAPKGQLVAILGLDKGDNLFLRPDGGWVAGYIPNAMRAYPFALAETSNEAAANTGAEALRLCFDHDSGLYREQARGDEREPRFVDDHGQWTPIMAQLLQFLRQSEQNRRLTDRAVRVLQSFNLLKHWQIESLTQGQALDSNEGLFCIDEERFNALDDAALRQLQDTHALPIVYAQLFSMSRLGVLKQIKAHRESAIKQTADSHSHLGLETFFSQERSDRFNFDT